MLPNNFAYLPDLSLELIFSYLNATEISNCSQVCKQWHHAIQSPSLWKRLCLQESLNQQFYSSNWKLHYARHINWSNEHYTERSSLNLNYAIETNTKYLSIYYDHVKIFDNYFITYGDIHYHSFALWDLSTHRPLQYFLIKGVGQGLVSSIQMNYPYIATGDNKGKIFLWKVGTSNPVSFYEMKGACQKISFNEQILVGGNLKKGTAPEIYVFDRKSKDHISTLSAHTFYISDKYLDFAFIKKDSCLKELEIRWERWQLSGKLEPIMKIKLDYSSDNDKHTIDFDKGFLYCIQTNSSQITKISLFGQNGKLLFIEDPLSVAIRFEKSFSAPRLRVFDHSFTVCSRQNKDTICKAVYSKDGKLNHFYKITGKKVEDKYYELGNDRFDTDEDHLLTLNTIGKATLLNFSPPTVKTKKRHIIATYFHKVFNSFHRYNIDN
ncbi:MAG: F-box-like [Chlamydiales bacterium]|jgi:hypothetical protein|nr:F-box-like [Chlamydiales bacterium]